MPLIDDLRETDWGKNVTDTLQRWNATRGRAADALEKLAGYVSHHDDCQIMTHGVWSDPIPCTCGLNALIKEIGVE